MCRPTAEFKALSDLADRAKMYADRLGRSSWAFGYSTQSSKRSDVFDPAAPKLLSTALLGVVCEWFHGMVRFGIIKPDVSRSAKLGLMLLSPTCVGIVFSRSISNNLARPAAPEAASQWPMLPFIELTTMGFVAET